MTEILSCIFSSIFIVAFALFAIGTVVINYEANKERDKEKEDD